MGASNFQYDLFRIIAPGALVGLLFALALSLGPERRRRRASGVYSVFLVACIGYIACNTFEISSSTEKASLFWSRMIYPFIVFIPVIWLEFCFRFSRGRGLARGLLLAFASVPAVTLVVVFVPGLSPLMWKSAEFFAVGGFVVSRRVHGPWFAVYAAYTYSLSVAGAFIVFRAIALYRSFYRRQAALVALGVAIPLAVSLVYVLHLIPGLIKDYTPLAYAATAGLFHVALYKRDLFALAPVARDFVVERMHDGILVFAPDGRLADANPAAFALLGIGEKALGVRLFGSGSAPESDLPQAIGEELRALYAEPGCREFPLATSGRERWIRAESTRLEDSATGGGVLLVLRDETEQKTLLKRVEELASVDSLTRLPNRRHFLECATREVSRASREGRALAAAMIDIDSFKSINDSRGHRAGDIVLASFSALLLSELRGEDLAGRLGGDEFALLVSGSHSLTDIESAFGLGERIRAKVEAARFVDDSGLAIPFTISVGVAVSDPEHPSLDALLAAADEALYAAKTAGRNRVAVHRGR